MIHVLVEVEEGKIISSSLSLSSLFSWELCGASADLKAHLDAWFRSYQTKTALPLDSPFLFERLTPFQRRVLIKMKEIPFGKTVSYKGLAEICKSGPRAVGGACGRNPFPFLIPCHRVIAQDGSLGGFSLDPRIKLALLAFEGLSK